MRAGEHWVSVSVKMKFNCDNNVRLKIENLMDRVADCMIRVMKNFDIF